MSRTRCLKVRRQLRPNFRCIQDAYLASLVFLLLEVIGEFFRRAPVDERIMSDEVETAERNCFGDRLLVD